MKNDKEKMCVGGAGPCSSGCWCGKCIRWKLLKLFLCLAVAFFVFVCGLGVGVKMSYYKLGGAGNEGWGMVKYGEVGESGRPGMMIKLMSAEEGAYGLTVQSHAIRLFGNITKIDGNKITVLDNSAKEQVILSQPETIITATGTEVGVASLKAGMNIVSIGAMNADNQLLAKTIRVQ